MGESGGDGGSKARMRKDLTDAFLRSLAAPASGRIEAADTRCAGLEYRITKGGTGSWSFRFVDPETGKPARATIGTYKRARAKAGSAPDIGLKAARAKADELRKAVEAGTNPAKLKRQQRRDAAAKSFEALSERYLATIKNPASDRFKRSADQDEANLNKHVLPKWRGRRYDRLTRADVIDLLDGIVAAGSPVQANRVQSLISGIFSFAIDEDLHDANPCARLRKRGAEGIGRRVLDDGELRLFYPRIIHSPATWRTGQGLRLALLTGSRIDEIAGIERAELSYLDDPERAAWLIPAERYKTKKPHLVPLAATALSIVRAVVETLPEGERFLFPARLETDAPMAGHSFTVAMARFGDNLAGSDPAVKTWRADPPSPHDCRRTVRTRLAELGTTKEDRDAVLGHGPASSDTGGKHYDVYDRHREKRAALALWDSALAQILEPAPVVRLAIHRAQG